MRKKFYLFLLRFAIPALGFVVLFGGKSAVADAILPDGALVVDNLNIDENEFPKNFRIMSEDALATRDINMQGLDRINISGSGQFSAAGLDYIKKKLATDSFYIIDLRSESHGFINGSAVSWYAVKNKGNSNRTPKEIESRQQQLLDSASKQSTVKIYLDKRAASDINKYGEYFTTQVNEAYSELELVQRQGIKYKRFYVLDGNKPDAKTVDEFVAFYTNLQDKDQVKLHFHCRAGRGRTTVFMVMTDILENSLSVSLEDILNRHISYGGKDLTDYNALPPEKLWKKDISVSRHEFIMDFYAYSRSAEFAKGMSYSSWLDVKSK